MDIKKRISEEIIKKILCGEIKNKQALEDIKKELCAKFKIDLIKNSEILGYSEYFVNEISKDNVLKLLRKKPSRTASGVSIVACMTQPSKCPHGKCAYCPGGIEINVPQSYTGKEPATRRAIQYDFDPYLETTFRLYQLKKIGHSISKVELIVMGGTLTAQCIDYAEYFVKRCIQAMNEFYSNIKLISDENNDKFDDNNKFDNKFGEAFIKEYKRNEKYRKFHFLEDVQKKNEKAKVRCVGITFEPRPDYAKKDEIERMLYYGVTRVEIGVQNPHDFIYRKVNRGHTVEDVIHATSLLKDYGLKVCYHMMPGLLGDSAYSREIDLKGFRKIFEDENFRPDMIKIYPCVVVKGTKYYEDYINKKFTPLTTENAIKLIADVKEIMPPWVRTMRIMRDIPADLIVAGVKASNLEQLVFEEMKKRGTSCRCIRCREVRFKKISENLKLKRINYNASGGEEIFLSYEDVENDILIGFLRLRKPSDSNSDTDSEKKMFVRELHVYGPEIEIGATGEGVQHKGFGKKLLMEAERIAKEEYCAKKILVTSGIGAREYYRKLGYRKEKFWMGKKL